MNKDIIKKHLNSTFLAEDKKPVGLDATEKVQKASKKSNKEYQSEVGKKMTDYDKASKTDEKKNADSVKKYENNKEQEEYHDDYETLNGQEMLKFDNEPSDSYKERAVKAIVGDSTMGNGPGANAEATWGASSDTFGKDLIKRVKSRVKKQDDAMQYDGMGDVAIPRGKNKENKSVAVAESTENKLNSNNKKMKRLKFKNAFNGVGNALQLIPESYKVDNKVFQMTDGNENYEIRWEGTVNEGRAVILKAEDKTMISENMAHMKHLMGYKSQTTLGNLKGSQRLDENAKFADVFNKTKALLENTESKSVIKEDKSWDDAANTSGDAHAPHVMSEEEEVNEYGNPGAGDIGHGITDNNALIKAVMNAVQKAPELGQAIMAKLEDWGSAAAAAKRMEEYGNPVASDRGLEITDNNALIKALRSAVSKAPELAQTIMAKLEDWGSAAAAAKRMEEYGNPGAGDIGHGITDNNALLKALRSAVAKAPELGQVIMAKLEDWGSAAAAAKRMEESDRFDEVFEGINEELSDEQSEEMDTDKDGDIDAKDLANLRNDK